MNCTKTCFHQIPTFQETKKKNISNHTKVINEETAMRNLIIDGAAGGETKRRHDVTFPPLTLHRGKDRVYFSTGFFQKENIVYTGVLQIFRTKN
jgi:hypothetical protein